MLTNVFSSDSIYSSPKGFNTLRKIIKNVLTDLNYGDKIRKSLEGGEENGL